MRPSCLVSIVLALALSPPAGAQDTEETRAFLNELLEISNGINSETAKDAAGKCLAMGERLNSIQGLAEPQRLYFEAEIDYCQFYAMNNGRFSDNSGDQCSHHLAYTTKFAAAIDGWLKVEGTQGEYMMNLANRLENAMRFGPELGCKGDYTPFGSTLAAAKTAGEKQPKEPDFAFMSEIMAVTQAITPETAKADVEKCNALSARMAEKKDLFPFEMHYYPALIESCIALAMEKGAPADGTGDACAHHYRRGELSLLALAEGRKQPGPFEGFIEMLREEMKGFPAVGQELGCKQDFSSLKEEP